jgi:hypothetical protein
MIGGLKMLATYIKESEIKSNTMDEVHMYRDIKNVIQNEPMLRQVAMTPQEIVEFVRDIELGSEINIDNVQHLLLLSKTFPHVWQTANSIVHIMNLQDSTRVKLEVQRQLTLKLLSRA